MKTIIFPKGSSDSLPVLAAYLEPFATLFRRSTSHTELSHYVIRLLTDLPRKNCEAIAQAETNTLLKQLQHLLPNATRTDWSWWKPACTS